MSAGCFSLRLVGRPLVALLLLLVVFSVRAHDPYEISATASLQTNRVELAVAMEFRTGLRLAGVEPRPPAGVSAADWFAQNQAALSACAKTFCVIQAGEKNLPIRGAAVTLGVEDHIEFRIEYPPATGQPLRFDVAGLKVLAGQGQYGVALTVLDMVNGKVLGQPVVFADAPSMAVEVAAPAENKLASPDTLATVEGNTVGASPTDLADSAAARQKTAGGLVARALVSSVVVLLLLVVFWRRQRHKE